MKRCVQILLMVVFLVPLFSSATEETMEERKRRITRKYMRERSSIAQSELEVPFANPAEDELADSEQFMESQVDLQRHEGGTPLPPPRQPRPAAANRNWLLAVDPLDSADSEEPEKKQQDWSTWGKQRDSGYGRMDQADQSPYSLGYGSRQEGDSGLREYKSFSFGRDPSEVQQQDSILGKESPGIYGRRQQDGSNESGFGSLNTPQDRVYNPTLKKGILQSPFLRESTPSATDPFGSGNTGSGYTPYKNPYEARRQQQQQQTWGRQDQQRQEYKPQNPYQNWKKRNQDRYDPTADDAFINEVMPKSR